jgi:hypothetical protein
MITAIVGFLAGRGQGRAEAQEAMDASRGTGVPSTPETEGL